MANFDAKRRELVSGFSERVRVPAYEEAGKAAREAVERERQRQAATQSDAPEAQTPDPIQI